jgi:hypothetical protein
LGRAVDGCHTGGIATDLEIVIGGSPDREGDIVISDPQTTCFAAHVHEVVDLDAREASPDTIEARVNSMTADREEQCALGLLALSLRNGANTHRGLPDRSLVHGHR